MGANLDSAYPAGVKIAIVMGSKSDWATMQFAADVLTTLNVCLLITSTHSSTEAEISY
ncbi:5-(carboxyamino)imidazole ribonucleotide mutase, partial [Yersinia enterocolitica]|nr:5-(carboxyamino)imidazole ribonucleotide mutase [Yersinia enterocolitica]